MPLNLAGEPVGGPELIQSALGRLRARGPVRLAAGGRAAVSAAVPHPVFDLHLDELVAGAGLERVHPAGWRYLIMEGGRAVAAAEVDTDTGGNATAVSVVNTGPFVAATREGIQQAEALPDVQQGAFDLTLLRVAALYVIALWLKNSQGGDDIIIPLPPAPPYLTPGQTYRPEEFLQRLRDAARQRATFPEPR